MSEVDELAVLRQRVIELEMEAKIAKSMLREEIASHKIASQEDQGPITHESLVELGFGYDYGEDLPIIGEQSGLATEYAFLASNHIEIKYYPSFGNMWSIVEWVGSESYTTEIIGPKTARELEVFIQCINAKEEESS